MERSSELSTLDGSMERSDLETIQWEQKCEENEWMMTKTIVIIQTARGGGRSGERMEEGKQ